MKKYPKTPVIIMIFPEVFKSAAVAIRRYMPGPLNDDMQAILGKMALCETERLVSLPAKHDSGPVLSVLLVKTERYIHMMVSFHRTHSTLEEFERMEANEALIDASIEGTISLFCARIKLPYHRK